MDNQNQNADNQSNEAQNLVLLENHLQVSNLIKILFTVNFNLIKSIVEQTPPDLQETNHFKVLVATYEYYKKVLEIHTGGQVAAQAEPGVLV